MIGLIHKLRYSHMRRSGVYSVLSGMPNASPGGNTDAANVRIDDFVRGPMYLLRRGFADH